MALEMLDKTHQINGGSGPVISARKAAEFLNLSKAVFFTAIDSEVIQWQAKIQDDPSDKPAYGFSIEYLEEVLRILPKKRSKTGRVFSEQIKEKIAAINNKWFEKLDYNRHRNANLMKKLIDKKRR